MKIYTRLEKESIVSFYKAVAEQLGYDTANTRYDPTKIKVSRERSDIIEEKYKEIGEARGVDWKMSFGMDWLCYGPQVTEELNRAEIELEDGFIYFEEEEKGE